MGNNMKETETFYSYPNRLVCSVLEEMRALDKAKNYGSLLGLIEEVQTLVNRMESALSDKRDIKEWSEKRRKLKKEVKKLTKKHNKLVNAIKKKKQIV